MNRKINIASRDTRINVLLIEDDLTIRDSIAFLLKQENEFAVIGEFSSIEAIKKKLPQIPDVILLDVELQGINGIDAIPYLRKMFPTVKIIMLTVYENEQSIFKALTNGASGYLTKNIHLDRIIEAIKEVIDGGGPMSASIARLVIKSFQKNDNTPLSKRESEVLESISEGKSRSRIANDLFIDIETVKTHIKNIYHKLNVNSKADALRVAKENKLI